MVRLTIREAAEKRGLTTAYQLQKKMDVPPGTAARLWRGDLEMVALKTLDFVCEKLECDLSEVIQREPSKLKTAVSGVKPTKKTRRKGSDQ